jgi:cytochrome c oxidase cbb3-type subunit I/II
MILMAWNLGKTALAGKPVNGTAEVTIEIEETKRTPWRDIVFGAPVIVAVVVFVLAATFAVTNLYAGPFFAIVAAMVGILGTIAVQASRGDQPAWHRLLEGRALLFTVLTVLAVLVGGVAEIVPSLLAEPDRQTLADARPYSALELEGRDIYLKEGCYNCHSQMIRPFRWEQQRYGEPSTMSESQFDHPFQWGSKRTGPDLAREGSKYPNLWHYRHLLDPREVSPGSNMPPYAHLAEGRIDLTRTIDKLRAMKSLGVPYTDDQIAHGADDARLQAGGIAADLATSGASVANDSELVALIAYLQRLGVKPPLPPAGANVSLNETGTAPAAKE